ncbi:MAG: TraB/GumN family protein [Oscillospiraceae bacterium]|nr:TraB/GumN family protein [Oscillospiraceae bacterium]
MKKFRRIASLLLCVALLCSLLAGCGNEPTPDATPDPGLATEPPAPTASEIYAQARAALDSAEDICLDVTVTTYTTVSGEEFSEQSVQTLTYQGLGTDSFCADMDSSLYYGIHLEDYDPEEAESISYRETYVDGTLYIKTEELFKFSAELDAEAAAARYIPVVLLDAELYGDITQDGDELLFAQPTAAESWALPEEAELTEAGGSVLLDASGAITEMEYSISYSYGPAEVRLEVQSTPKAESGSVTAPEKADSYQAIADADAPYLALRVPALTEQANTTATNMSVELLVEAAGYVESYSEQLYMHGHEADTQLKRVASDFVMAGYGQSESYEVEETFIGGRYTVTENGGLPETIPGVDWETMRDVYTPVYNDIVPMDFWTQATVTDMGSVYLLEFELSEEFGNSRQNTICSALWDDPAFLYNKASHYEMKKGIGYLSVDKFTGLPVAIGYEYEGVHTIQGVEYSLSARTDQSVEAPAKGAYKEITGEMLPETEPENKAAPLFYHVTGEDGQEMWLLGTIHVGDERTGYLPQEIRDAFEASDALALECDVEAFDEQVKEDEALQAELAKAYYFADGTTVESLMEEEEYARTLQVLKATGNCSSIILQAKPYVWSDAIDAFNLRQGQFLHRDQGVESRLTAWAEELEKPIREVESSMFQIQMFANFSLDLQLLMLEGSVETTFQEYWEGTQELYELWCAGDEAALRELIADEFEPDEDMTEEELAEYEENKHLIEEYEKAIDTDRNEGMLKVAMEYLESGETVFYAVGLAHLLDNTNGLVDTLRANGYTVELVSYQ